MGQENTNLKRVFPSQVLAYLFRLQKLLTGTISEIGEAFRRFCCNHIAAPLRSTSKGWQIESCVLSGRQKKNGHKIRFRKQFALSYIWNCLMSFYLFHPIWSAIIPNHLTSDWKRSLCLCIIMVTALWEKHIQRKSDSFLCACPRYLIKRILDVFNITNPPRVSKAGCGMPMVGNEHECGWSQRTPHHFIRPIPKLNPDR